VIAEARDIGREVRQLLYGAYRILFDVQEESSEGPLVRVLRIWHGARDKISISDLDAE
jgi:plasmid stabilization system protein ParE